MGERMFGRAVLARVRGLGGLGGHSIGGVDKLIIIGEWKNGRDSDCRIRRHESDPQQREMR
jgi:hypothetical protein